MITLLLAFSMAMAQNDPIGGSQQNPINQNSGQQNVFDRHNDQNASGSGTASYQHASTQNSVLYNGTEIEVSEVSQRASDDFSTRYPDWKKHPMV